VSSPAAQNGYRDGLEIGRRDARDGQHLDAGAAKWFRNGDRDYNRRYGSRDDYKRDYRRATILGRLRDPAITATGFGLLRMRADAVRATSRSKGSHERATTPDAVKANSPRVMSQKQARDLCVQGTKDTPPLTLYGRDERRCAE
jgi:hypothetical protein